MSYLMHYCSTGGGEPPPVRACLKHTNHAALRFLISCPVRGPTEHSLSYRAPTLEPSVPVLGGVRPRVENAGFGPTFFRPSLPEGETQQTKKLPRDKCPISPTKSKSIGTEGSCLGPFPRVICTFSSSTLPQYLCFRGVLHGSSATQGGDTGARARAVTLQHRQNDPESREWLCVMLANALLPVTTHAFVLHRAETEHRVPSPLGLIHSCLDLQTDQFGT